MTKDSRYLTADEMLAELDKLFLPKQESALARQEFMDYKQNPVEPALAYFANKRILFDKGYPNKTDLTFLLLQTQAGLASRHVKRALLEVSHQFRTFEQLRDHTITLIAAQRKAIMDGLSYDTCMDGLNSTTPYHQTSLGYQGTPKTEEAAPEPARPQNQWGAQAPAKLQSQWGQGGLMQSKQCLPSPWFVLDVARQVIGNKSAPSEGRIMAEAGAAPLVQAKEEVDTRPGGATTSQEA
ncbi:MAG: hypothetical protein GY696_32695 [Gammaproteobacteria bacterium]|nr:hypothetical protein [Gammaproteobacteria bacterium]